MYVRDLLLSHGITENTEQSSMLLGSIFQLYKRLKRSRSDGVIPSFRKF